MDLVEFICLMLCRRNTPTPIGNEAGSTSFPVRNGVQTLALEKCEGTTLPKRRSKKQSTPPSEVLESPNPGAAIRYGTIPCPGLCRAIWEPRCADAEIAARG